jgi:hypothetical protein
VQDDGDPYPPSPSPDFNFSWHGGPYFEVQFSDLFINTERGHNTGCQYFQHFTAVHIITSQHATSFLGSSPKTTSGAGKASMSKAETSQYTGEIQMGLHSAGSGIEKVKDGLKIVVNNRVRRSLGDERNMRWVYEVDDDTETTMGLTVLPGPHVKLGFEDIKLCLEVEVLTVWSMSTSPSSGQWSGLTRGSPSKNKPPFTNFIQRARISLPMENLKGSCRTPYSIAQVKTEAPLQGGHIHAQKEYGEKVESKDGVADLNINFGCALYSEVNNKDSQMTGVSQKHQQERKVGTEQYLVESPLPGPQLRPPSNSNGV